MISVFPFSPNHRVTKSPWWLNLDLTILEPPFMQALLSCTPFLAVSCSNLYWPESSSTYQNIYVFQYSHLVATFTKASLIMDFHFCSSIPSNLLRTAGVWSSWTHFWPHLLTYMWRQLCLFQICPVMAVVLHPFWTFEWLVESRWWLPEFKGLFSRRLLYAFLKGYGVHLWSFPPLSWVFFYQICGRRLWENHN